MIEEELKEIFNLEITRELMKEINPDASDNDVEHIYKKCDGRCGRSISTPWTKTSSTPSTKRRSASFGVSSSRGPSPPKPRPKPPSSSLSPWGDYADTKTRRPGWHRLCHGCRLHRGTHNPDCLGQPGMEGHAVKRSPLTRKTPLKAKAGIQRKPMKLTSHKKTAAKKAARSDVRWRSSEYLAWVRSLPCACCQGPGGDAHHLIGMWGLSGTGLTAPDNYTMPLCRACHQEVHRNPDLQQAQPEWLRLTLERALLEYGNLNGPQALRLMRAMTGRKESDDAEA